MLIVPVTRDNPAHLNATVGGSGRIPLFSEDAHGTGYCCHCEQVFLSSALHILSLLVVSFVCE